MCICIKFGRETNDCDFMVFWVVIFQLEHTSDGYLSINRIDISMKQKNKN